MEIVMKGKAGLFRPTTLAEALELLATLPDAKLIAGGASLVAMMNARIVEPAALVDLARIGELTGIVQSPTGEIAIGVMTRHCEIANAAAFTGTLSVIADAAKQIANATVRNMGTIGGAIAHADPGLDFPPAIIAAQATVEIASSTGSGRIPAREFFVDWYTTRLDPREIIVAVHLPKPKPGAGIYLKHARVAGDFAIVSIALSSARDGETHVAVGGCGPTPLSSLEVDTILSSSHGEAAVAQAGELLVALSDPIDDVRGSADYRRKLIPRMLHRALFEASARGDA
ncbi:MAG: xanthine dehydrogenase family protein subunit M [Xanthobacteraceae bacterium]|nr:MAG: xanthine dehydrogenase family protein subunit M [Xanthobacteraceae bacterium]